MAALVTGATGFLGNNLVRLLLARDLPVRVLVRPGRDPRPLASLPVEVHEAQLSDLAALERALAGADVVFHCAGCVRIGWRDRALHQAVNVDATRRVASAAARCGVRMVHVSSVNSLGVGSWQQPANEEQVAAENVPCPYVISKQRGEQAVLDCIEKDGLDAVIAHPSYMLGPWDWKPSSGQLLLQVAARFTPVAPKGGASLCDVRDVAEGLIQAWRQAPSGRHYVLAGHNLSYLKLWRLFADCTGARGPWFGAGPLMRIAAGRWGDFCGRLAGRERELNSAAIRMSDLPHYFSSARAERELNYQIRPARQSVTDAWQWFQQHGYT